MIGARDKTAKEIIQIKGKAMKDLEVSFDHDIVVPKEDYESVIDEVLADGLAQMRVKGKDVSINQLIAAAKIKGDWRAKKRGQDTELIKMMYRSMNGFTEKPSTVGTGGSERPSDLLREVAGNATPSGSEALFASSSPTTG
jgi:hypothetical protein